MSNTDITEKKDYKYRKIIFEVLIVLLLLIFSISITPKEFQNDTFYTIKCGEYIYNNGISNLTEDQFSWMELPYTYPHWMYDLGVFIIFSNFGYVGVYIATILFATLLGYLVYTICKIRSKDEIIAAIISLVILYCMKPYITARAQLVTFTLFLFELYCIEKLLETHKKRYLVYLFFIPLLITQLHCAVFPMFFVFAMPYIAEFLLVVISDLNLFDRIVKLIFKLLIKFSKNEDRKSKFAYKIEKINKVIENSKIEKKEKRNKPYKIIRNKDKIIIWLIGVIIISSATGLINPAGTGAYTYIIKTAKGNTMQSINEHLPLTLIGNKEFSVAIVLLILTLLLTDIKIRLSDFFMIAGLMYLSFKSSRQISLFFVMCAPIYAKILCELIKRLDKDILSKVFKFSTERLGIIILMLLITLCSQQEYKKIADQKYVNESSYPVSASKWIKENLDLESLKLYNEYNFGSYLVLEGIPVFIDSRCDLYTPQFNGDNDLDIFSDSLNVTNMSDDYGKIFDKYGINYAIMYSSNTVCKMIDNDSNYSKVYQDDCFVIYHKLDSK